MNGKKKSDVVTLHASNDRQPSTSTGAKLKALEDGLPLGSSLPLSSDKALVQTETTLVSNSRKEQVGEDRR